MNWIGVRFAPLGKNSVAGRLGTGWAQAAAGERTGRAHGPMAKFGYERSQT